MMMMIMMAQWFSDSCFYRYNYDILCPRGKKMIEVRSYISTVNELRPVEVIGPNFFLIYGLGTSNLLTESVIYSKRKKLSYYQPLRSGRI